MAPLSDWFRSRQPIVQDGNDQIAGSENDPVEWHRREHDEQENNEGVPPETEEIRQYCIWMVEAFPPSKIQALKDGLQNLGWNAQSPIDVDPVGAAPG
jgi:hypothetical protein